ncbi:MAG: hypothetical protein O6765_07585 [Gammaproteobacteria bacterium]|nr:hypothetical protein [Gammaproteobacteria bacterium]
MTWAVKQRWVIRLAYVFSGLTLITCLFWYFMNFPEIEPWAVLFALSAAALGSYSQFRIIPMLERSARLSALMHELAKNMSIYQEHYTKVSDKASQLTLFHQYHMSVAESCIAQGVLDPVNDRELFNKLNELHDKTRQVNSLLGIEQSNMMAAINLVDAKTRYERIVGSRAMASIRDCMNELYDLLQQRKYADLHGVEENTVLFRNDTDAAS